jgi:branched-chain amino acid transport system substrate-binding protein
MNVAATADFKPGDAGSAAAAVVKANADAVIVIARDGAQGALAELGNAGVDGKRILLSDGAFARYGSRLPAKFLDGARAVVAGQLPDAEFQARLLGVDPGLKDVSFAAEAYDAVTVAALAAARAQDDAAAPSPPTSSLLPEEPWKDPRGNRQLKPASPTKTAGRG